MMRRFVVTLAREVRDLEVARVVVEAPDAEAARGAALELVEPADPPHDWLGWDDWRGEKRLDCEAAQVEEVVEVPRRGVRGLP